jgi:glycosyltransferase involved in cell wall biosynthesis
MSEPLVSVVIPSFNYGHLVGEAVDSVLVQTYPNVEVIVVDDGSTDDTRQRLAKYGERIRYHYQPNAGLSAARNTGIGLAEGEYIALLDSDDAFHPEKLAVQMAVLTKHPTLGLVGTDEFSDEPVEWTSVQLADIDAATEMISLEQAVIKAQFAPSSILARRECFELAGLFDTELKSVEDRDMWIRIAARLPLATIHWPLTWYRHTTGSMSRNAAKMEHFEQVVLRKAFAMPELRGRWLLRQKAHGLAAYSAAYMYLSSGERRLAWQRMIASFLQWPLPISVPNVRYHFARTRLLLRSSLAGMVGR